MLNKILRGFLAAVLTIAMVCPYAQVAFAEEVEEPEVPVIIDEYGTNSLVAMCAGTIDSTVDTLTCNITSGTPQCTVFATIAFDSTVPNVLVDCYFELPNGSSYSLGAVPARGGETFHINFYYLLPGEYTFYFQTTATVEASGFVFI